MHRAVPWGEKAKRTTESETVDEALHPLDSSHSLTSLPCSSVLVKTWKAEKHWKKKRQHWGHCVGSDTQRAARRMLALEPQNKQGTKRPAEPPPSISPKEGAPLLSVCLTSLVERESEKENTCSLSPILFPFSVLSFPSAIITNCAHHSFLPFFESALS